MKKSIIIIAAIFMIGFTTKVMAQAQTANIISSASAKIVATIQIEAGALGSDLQFGSMSRPSSVATVSVSSSNGRTFSGSVTPLTQGTNPKASYYKVTADPNALYTITLPSSSIVSNGIVANDMTIDGFTCSATNLATVTTDGSGFSYFSVGATLNLANAQPSGSYTGTFPIVVTYN